MIDTILYFKCNIFYAVWCDDFIVLFILYTMAIPEGDKKYDENKLKFLLHTGWIS